MAARAQKHTHQWTVISHTADWDHVLIMCAVLSCGATEARHAKRNVKPDVAGMEHRCCG